MCYKETFAGELIRFFRQSEPASPPSLCKFAYHIGAEMASLREWCKCYPAFRDAVEEARIILQDKLIDWGLSKQCDATFAKYLLSDMNAMWPEGNVESVLDVHIMVSQ